MATVASSRVGAGAGAGHFTRQASGLVRELGIPAATGIALASVAVTNTFINFNAGLTGFSMADMTLPLILAAGIWLVAMFAYRYLLEAIPRAGGEYVYLSRIVSPIAGALVGISIALVFTYTLSANAHFAASYVPFMLTGLGAAFNSNDLANAANNVTDNNWQAGLSVAMLVIVGLLSIFSLRRMAQVILAMVIFQVLAFALLGVMLIFKSHSDFVAALGTFSNHANAYSAILQAAQHDKIPLGVSLGAMLACVPFMVLNYNGVLYSYYVGGELKRPGRTYLYASAISIGVLVVVWVGIWLLMLKVVGLDFMQAQTNLGATDPTAYGKITSLQASATGLGYGLVLSGDPITKIIFALAIPVTEIAVDLAFVAVVTRVLFALAFDRLLPVWVAKVNERNSSPTNAIIIAVAVGIGFAILATYVNVANIVANLSLFFALILLAGSLAAAILPYRRPDLIMRPGATEIRRYAGVPAATWVGGISAILALITVGVIIANPGVFGQFSVTSVASLVIVLLLGPVIYLVARQIRRQQSSIDMGLAMRELPPE